jgi:hypothetical protein
MAEPSTTIRVRRPVANARCRYWSGSAADQARLPACGRGRQTIRTVVHSSRIHSRSPPVCSWMGTPGRMPAWTNRKSPQPNERSRDSRNSKCSLGWTLLFGEASCSESPGSSSKERIGILARRMQEDWRKPWNITPGQFSSWSFLHRERLVGAFSLTYRARSARRFAIDRLSSPQPTAAASPRRPRR